MEIKKIEELIKKKSLSKEDKAAITAAADAAGMDYKITSHNCRKCYDGILLKLFEAANTAAAAANAAPEGSRCGSRCSRDGWRFKRPYKRFMIGGVIYHEGNIQDFEVGTMHPFVRNYYFEMCPENCGRKNG